MLRVGRCPVPKKVLALSASISLIFCIMLYQPGLFSAILIPHQIASDPRFCRVQRELPLLPIPQDSASWHTLRKQFEHAKDGEEGLSLYAYSLDLKTYLKEYPLALKLVGVTFRDRATRNRRSGPLPPESHERPAFDFRSPVRSILFCGPVFVLTTDRDRSGDLQSCKRLSRETHGFRSISGFGFGVQVDNRSRHSSDSSDWYQSLD